MEDSVSLPGPVTDDLCGVAPMALTDQQRSADLSDFLASVAAIPLDPNVLSCVSANVFYARGSLGREVRRQATVAIRTLREVIRAAQALSAELGDQSGSEGTDAAQMDRESSRDQSQ